MQNHLDNFDTIKLNEARKVIVQVMIITCTI